MNGYELEVLSVKRGQALMNADWSVVREIDAQMARLRGEIEMSVPDVAMERAVPVKRKPGRPRKTPIV